MRKLIAAVLALFLAAPAVAQINPQSLPANTVYGRLGIGTGPGQAIPLSVLTGDLLGTLGCTTSGQTAVYNAITGTWVCTSASVPLVLPNGTTATTQSTSDNTTDVATDAFVQTAISGQTTHFAAAGVTTGSANAQVIATVSPPVFSFSGNPTVSFIAGFSNTGATTLNVASTGVKNVLKKTTTGLVNLATGDLVLNQQYLATYDGTEYELQGPSSIPLLNSVDIWSAHQYFGSGRPWVDVRAGTNSCAAAAGNGSTDDSGAINCQAAVIAGQGGGILYFPVGNYHVASTLTIGYCVILQGAGWATSGIFASTDITVISFVSTGCSQPGGGLYRMQVGGYQNSAATQDMVTIASNLLIDIEDTYLSGGHFAVNTAGVDGHFSNVNITGWGTTGGGIYSTGANWYEHVRDDQGSTATLAAFEQGPSPSIAFENHFVNSDFSGSYTNSILIADTNNRAITTVMGSVFGAAISATGGKSLMLVGNEVGAAISSSIPTMITGSWSISGTVTPTGAGPFACAANDNILCGTNYARNQSTPSNPTGTANTSGLMMGLAGSITPTTTGNISVSISGSAGNSTSGDGCTLKLRYGTGTAPSNAGALTGTIGGNSGGQNTVSSAANAQQAFNLPAYITGLTVGTAYWLDLSAAAVTGGTCTPFNNTIIALEQ